MKIFAHTRSESPIMTVRKSKERTWINFNRRLLNCLDSSSYSRVRVENGIVIFSNDNGYVLNRNGSGTINFPEFQGRKQFRLRLCKVSSTEVSFSIAESIDNTKIDNVNAS